MTVASLAVLRARVRESYAWRATGKPTLNHDEYFAALAEENPTRTSRLRGYQLLPDPDLVRELRMAEQERTREIAERRS